MLLPAEGAIVGACPRDGVTAGVDRGLIAHNATPLPASQHPKRIS
jgi:hypothetical protein